MLFLYTKKSHIVASCKGKGEVYMYVNMAQSTHITHTQSQSISEFKRVSNIFGITKRMQRLISHCSYYINMLEIQFHLCLHFECAWLRLAHTRESSSKSHQKQLFLISTANKSTMFRLQTEEKWPIITIYTMEIWREILFPRDWIRNICAPINHWRYYCTVVGMNHN